MLSSFASLFERLLLLIASLTSMRIFYGLVSITVFSVVFLLLGSPGSVTLLINALKL